MQRDFIGKGMLFLLTVLPLCSALANRTVDLGLGPVPRVDFWEAPDGYYVMNDASIKIIDKSTYAIKTTTFNDGFSISPPIGIMNQMMLIGGFGYYWIDLSKKKRLMENNPIDKLNANDVFIYKDHLFAQVKNTLYSLQIQITPEREVVWGEVKKISGPADLPDRAKGDPNNVNTKDMHRFPDWFTAQSPSGKLLYVNQSGSAVVFVFDLEHQKFLRTLKLKQEIEHLTVSDRYLVGHVYNDGEDNVRVYDLQGKEVKLIRKVCPRNIRGRITFLSGDGKHLVAQCSGYTFTEGKEYAGLQVFRTGTWDRVGEVVLPFETASQVVLSEDGKRVLFVDLEGKLQVWDLLASLRRVK